MSARDSYNRAQQVSEIILRLQGTSVSSGETQWSPPGLPQPTGESSYRRCESLPRAIIPGTISQSFSKLSPSVDSLTTTEMPSIASAWPNTHYNSCLQRDRYRFHLPRDSSGYTCHRWSCGNPSATTARLQGRENQPISAHLPGSGRLSPWVHHSTFHNWEGR